MIAPVPAHELVQAAHPLDLLVPGLDEEVEGVAEHHLVAERGDLVRLERLHRRGRGERDERRRAHVAVRRTKNARAGGAVAGVDRESGQLRSRLDPVISAGGSMPISSSTVGATSARMPPARSSAHLRGHDERHGVQRVRRVRAAVRLEHVVRVAVVGGDDARPAARRARPRRPGPGTRPPSRRRPDRGRDRARVPDHVRVREVDDPEAVVVRAPVLDERRGRLARAHLRLVVVGRHVARRVHERALLARVRVLLAAVEEVRDVRVLLGLRDVQLADVPLGEERCQRHRRALRRERDRIAPVLVVLGQRRQVDVRADQLAQLPRAVGAEVEEDDGVALAHAALLPHQRRHDELVGLPALVCGAHGGLAGRRRVLGLALDDRVVRELRALPAAVAVHRVVAAADGRDPRAAPATRPRRRSRRPTSGSCRGRR